MPIDPQTRIGVDLDNTLIDYERAFLTGAREMALIPEGWQGSKTVLREYLRAQENGELLWQQLQGQTYGKYIEEARLYPGALRFLWRCRQRGIQVDIVSHKTEYGHYDAMHIPLRDAAKKFLERRSVLASKDGLIVNALFLGTKEEKLHYIAEAGFDIFIDDLPEILLAPELPVEIRKLLFLGYSGHDETTDVGLEAFNTWSAIERNLLGSWTEAEVSSLLERLNQPRLNDVSLIRRGGNSSLFKISQPGGTACILKLYPDDEKHDRLATEFTCCSLLNKHLGDVVPKPIACDRELNLATYEWIEGEPISTITADHVASALAFIEKLHSIRTHTDFALFPPASAAILSYADLETQLRSRLEILAPYCQKYPLLKAFVDGQLTPLVDRVTERLRADGSGGSRYNKKLSKLQQTLSPSDFGFHNVIRSAERGLVFVDFEYFGWDDPAKLIVDFALHAGMNLSPELQRAWVDGALAIYGADVRDRLMAIWPAIGLCWCLILLNEYRTDVWLRRARDRVDIREQRDLILQHQLQCSMDLLNDIKEGRFAQLFGKNIVQ